MFRSVFVSTLILASSCNSPASGPPTQPPAKATGVAVATPRSAGLAIVIHGGCPSLSACVELASAVSGRDFAAENPGHRFGAATPQSALAFVGVSDGQQVHGVTGVSLGDKTDDWLASRESIQPLGANNFHDVAAGRYLAVRDGVVWAGPNAAAVGFTADADHPMPTGDSETLFVGHVAMSAVPIPQRGAWLARLEGNSLGRSIEAAQDVHVQARRHESRVDVSIGLRGAPGSDLARRTKLVANSRGRLASVVPRGADLYMHAVLGLLASHDPRVRRQLDDVLASHKLLAAERPEMAAFLDSTADWAEAVLTADDAELVVALDHNRRLGSSLSIVMHGVAAETWNRVLDEGRTLYEAPGVQKVAESKGWPSVEFGKLYEDTQYIAVEIGAFQREFGEGAVVMFAADGDNAVAVVGPRRRLEKRARTLLQRAAEAQVEPIETAFQLDADIPDLFEFFGGTSSVSAIAMRAVPAEVGEVRMSLAAHDDRYTINVSVDQRVVGVFRLIGLLD